jgi:Ca-activated chloride channel homolog
MVYNQAHMASRYYIAACLGTLFSLFALPGLSQPPAIITPRAAVPATPPVESPIVRIDSSLVLIPTHVLSPAGAPVMGLRRENFHLLEDNVAQTISHFDEDDAPVSIGVLFDASGSMRDKIQISAQAVKAFFETANTEDEFFLVKFNDRATLSVPFTKQPDVLYQEITRTRAMGQTSLIDAIYLALGQMKKAKYTRKALVIFSDGGDNWSRHTVSGVKKALLEADVLLYAVGIFDEDVLTAEERRGPKLLANLAELTGGRNLPVEQIGDLPTISARIGRELRTEYVLGYYSTNPARDGKYRRITVSLDLPGPGALPRADHRPGYYAPIQ